jgi:hypothetical protein
LTKACTGNIGLYIIDYITSAQRVISWVIPLMNSCEIKPGGSTFVSVAILLCSSISSGLAGLTLILMANLLLIYWIYLLLLYIPHFLLIAPSYVDFPVPFSLVKMVTGDARSRLAVFLNISRLKG